MKRKLVAAGLSAVLALAVAACGDGDDPVDDGGLTDDTSITDTSLDTGADTTLGTETTMGTDTTAAP